MGTTGECGFDLCPDDPEDFPGVCGCGRSEEEDIDSDGDTVPDCIDRCPGIDDLALEDQDDHTYLPLSCELAVIPTVSEWGLIVMTLLLLTGGTVKLARRRAVKTPT